MIFFPYDTHKANFLDPFNLRQLSRYALAFYSFGFFGKIKGFPFPGLAPKGNNFGAIKFRGIEPTTTVQH